MLRSFTRWSIFLANSLLSLLISACASRAPGVGPRYPPRRPGCALSIFHTDQPRVAAWDDIGKVEIVCHIDDTERTCLNRLRAEACRLGGDIVYRVPVKPWHPGDQTMGYTMGYRAMVAHSRRPADRGTMAARPPDDDLPPPATPEEAAGPVVPLTGPGAPPAASADGGAAN